MFCILCGNNKATEIQVLDHEKVNQSKVKCERCGSYLYNGFGEAPPQVSEEIRPLLHLLSGLCRHQWDDAKNPFILTKEHLRDYDIFLKEVISLVPTDIPGKAQALLRTIASHSKFPGYSVGFSLGNDYPLAYCLNTEEFRYYLKHLEGLGLISLRKEAYQNGNMRIPTCLTPAGWDRLTGEAGREGSNQCFVAMWFHESMEEAFGKGIKPLADPKETGFSMYRVDKKEFNDKIDDKILAEIKASRFMIADVTGHRQAVYFEAGYAKGLGLPVIWCCHKEAIEKCSFDTRQYHHIVWETPEELKEKLKARISVTIGLPSKKASPAPSVAAEKE
jgi:hypothetical protein